MNIPMDDDDLDEWWADALTADERATIVAGILAAKPEDIPKIAARIFRLGHENGYEMAVDLSVY